MRKKYYCIDCNKEIGNKATRCGSCAAKKRTAIPENNPRYVDGRHLIKHYCKDCGKEVCVYSKQCKICFLKNPPFKKEKYNKCIDCGGNTKNQHAKRCFKCHTKFNIKENNPLWLERKNCKICGNKVKSLKAFVCNKCRNNYLYTLPHYLKALAQGKVIKPNKPETKIINILKNILPKEYKYVGNFKFWVERYNPDFVNCNGQKKIIELFGDYWHNKEEVKTRDIKRLETYKKYGYETLVVWEKELKDLNKLKEKIINFTKTEKE